MLFIDSSMSLKSFNLEIPAQEPLKMTLSAIDTSYDVCYTKSYIQKAAIVQKILKGVVDSALIESEGPSPAIVLSKDSAVRVTSYQQLYINHEYLNWL